MEASVPGTDRYILSVVSKSNGSLPRELPQELVPSLSAVHPAMQRGMVFTLGVDLWPEVARAYERDPMVLKLLNLSRMKLGLADREPQLGADSDAEAWMAELPGLRDPSALGPLEDVPGAYTTQTGLTIRTRRMWKPGPTLDQNAEYSSVAYSLVHHLNALPRRNAYDGTFAAGLHRRAVRLEARLEGAETSLASPVTDLDPSLDSGLRALREMGHINQYRYAFSYESMVKWLLYRGGVSLGMDCYEGMLVPDAQGYARPSGRKIGRIAVFCRGVNQWGDLRLQYSYGERFGHRGMLWMSRADAVWLMQNDPNFRCACWRQAKQKK